MRRTVHNKLDKEKEVGKEEIRVEKETRREMGNDPLVN